MAFSWFESGIDVRADLVEIHHADALDRNKPRYSDTVT